MYNGHGGDSNFFDIDDVRLGSWVICDPCGNLSTLEDRLISQMLLSAVLAVPLLEAPLGSDGAARILAAIGPPSGWNQADNEINFDLLFVIDPQIHAPDILQKLSLYADEAAIPKHQPALLLSLYLKPTSLRRLCLNQPTPGALAGLPVSAKHNASLDDFKH